MNQIKNRYTGTILCEYKDGVSLPRAIEKATKERTELRDADLSGAYLRGADLSGAYLRGADLSGSDLSGAYLRGADLSEADLSEADLSEADLSGADLAGANLSDAHLAGANLSDAHLAGAYLRDDAKLIGVRPILQIGPIGSRSDFLVAYITDKGLRFDVGCQRQITREAFESRLNETHGDNDHAKEYRAALALVNVHTEIWSKK